MKDIIKKFCNSEWQEFLNFHIKIAHYKAGEQIIKEGQKTLGLFIIESGRVKITRSSAEYDQRVIRIATAGDILGHRGFGGDWSYPISAFCYTDTSVQFIPLRVLNNVLKNNSKFSYQLILFFADEIRDSEFLNNNHSVKERIAWVLLKNIDVFGITNDKKFNFTIPRKDIASFALTTYESVIRTLSELKKEQILSAKGKDLYINNLSQLKKIISRT